MQCPPLPSKKKPDAKKTTDDTTKGTKSGETTVPVKTSTPTTTKTGGSLPPPSTPADATVNTTPDWLQTVWENANKQADEKQEDEKRLKKIKKEFESIFGITLPLRRGGSFDAGNTNLLGPSLPLPQATSIGNSPQITPNVTPAGTPQVSPNTTTFTIPETVAKKATLRFLSPISLTAWARQTE